MTTHHGAVFTVVWEGFVKGGTMSNTYSNVVRPHEYGYSQSPSNEELGIMACAEQHDGEDPYDEVNVLFVYFGDNNPIDLLEPDEDDVEHSDEPE